MLLSPVPSEKPDFHCHNHLSFLPGTGRKLTVRTASLDFALTLCLCGKKKSDHEMGLKFSVYHGARTPTGAQLPFVFK